MSVGICKRSEVEERVSSSDCVIVIDALRASVTTIVLLEVGASSVRPVREVEPATVDSEMILVGEENGKRIQGFDFCNSPTEVREAAEMVEGKDVVLRTSNGTQCVRDVAHASVVLMGSLVNREALVDAVAEIDREIWIVPAKRHGEYAREDMYSAAHLLESLSEGTDTSVETLTRYIGDSVTEVFTRCATGRHLASLGYEEDIKFCSQSDSCTAVPKLVEGRFELKET